MESTNGVKPLGKSLVVHTPINFFFCSLWDKDIINPHYLQDSNLKDLQLSFVFLNLIVIFVWFNGPVFLSILAEELIFVSMQLQLIILSILFWQVTLVINVKIAGQTIARGVPDSKTKEWELELLMEKLRSKGSSLKSLPETGKNLRMAMLVNTNYLNSKKTLWKIELLTQFF